MENQNNPENGTKKSINIGALGGVFLLISIIVVGGIYFYISTGDDTDDSTTINTNNENINADFDFVGDTDETEAINKILNTRINSETNVNTTNTANKSTCFDSDSDLDPDDIYTKGSVITTSTTGEQTTVYDDCSGTDLQVNEAWCYESPSGSGNFVRGKMVHNCPNGCIDGACVVPDEDSGWQTYRNEIYNYTIKYPGSWRVSSSVGDSKIILIPAGVSDFSDSYISSVITIEYITDATQIDSLINPRTTKVGEIVVKQGDELGATTYNTSFIPRDDIYIKLSWAKSIRDDVYSQIFYSFRFID